MDWSVVGLLPNYWTKFTFIAFFAYKAKPLDISKFTHMGQLKSLGMLKKLCSQGYR